MHRIATVLCLAAAGCATERAALAPPPANPEAGEVLRAAELARVRCLLVAPFENTSNASGAADTATGALLSGIDPARTRVFPVPELRALFRDTALELPQGIAPSLALELAEIIGADAALYGSVEGRSQDASAELLVTMRLTLTGERKLLFAYTAVVKRAPGERPETAVRRAVLETSRPMLARLGDFGRKRCFDPERKSRLRKLALDAKCAAPTVALEKATSSPAPAAPPEPQPVAPPAATSAPTASAAAATPAPPKASEPPRSPRQAEWVKRIAAGDRFLVDDVSFAGRTAELQRDRGLQDLAAALQAHPTVKVRLEGFVDATSDRPGDARISLAMAKAATERIASMGVARHRLAFAGRGGENPILPNFTARGRTANRRIEVVVLR